MEDSNMDNLQDGFFHYNQESDRFFIAGKDIIDLHCGQCFQIELDGTFTDTRIEMNPTTDNWYLVGIKKDIFDLIGSRVKY